METNLIEKYDKLRINLMIGAAITWGLFYSISIFKDLIENSVLASTIRIVGLAALAFFLYFLIRMIRIKSIMKNNPQLRSALENEWVIQNRRKAYAIGYWAMLSSGIIGLNLFLFTSISAKIILELNLFIGVLTLIIAFIVLNKRG